MKSIYFKYRVRVYVGGCLFFSLSLSLCRSFLLLAGGDKMTFICVSENLPNSNHINGEGRTEVKFFKHISLYIYAILCRLDDLYQILTHTQTHAHH